MKTKTKHTEVGRGEDEYFEMLNKLEILGMTISEIRQMKKDLVTFGGLSPDELDLAFDCIADQLVDNNSEEDNDQD